jgi:hypothetical protein
LIEGYGKVRLGIFELRAGRSKKITGLCDTTLTSGSWAISGTNLGIPEVELSVRDFWTLAWFDQLFSFKGNFSHGWMSNLSLSRYIEDTLYLNSYLHQKSFYGRFGKPYWKLKLFGGFNHQVVWGHEQEYYNDINYTLTPLETFIFVLTGKKYSSGNIQEERQGNHLGSIDIGLEYEFEKIKLVIYRQNLYEAGALAHLANIRDGLNGIILKRKQNLYKEAKWDKLLFELLYTKNQAGEAWSPYTPSPYEPYFNHGQYTTGWSYLGAAIGNPFITTRAHIRKDLATAPKEYFINNRVMAIHIGGEGSLKSINYLLKVTWSRNFGTYYTTDEEQSTGITNPGEYGVFGEQHQLSGFLELNRQLNNGINIGFVAALDYGELYYNALGLFLKASYSFYL